MSKMYNEEYHPFTGENLADAVFPLTDELEKEFMRQNDEYIAAKKRDYYIVLIPPTQGKMEDGSANGLWMHIQNGHMTGSCYDAIQ